jgi:eukaryotic-like serine/threonine-protein kinase
MQAVRCQQGHTWQTSGQETVALCPVCGGSPTVVDEKYYTSEDSALTISDGSAIRPPSQEDTTFKLDGADDSVHTIDDQSVLSAVRPNEAGSTLKLPLGFPTDQTVGFNDDDSDVQNKDDTTLGFGDAIQSVDSERTFDLPRDATRRESKGDQTALAQPQETDGTLPITKNMQAAKPPTLKSRRNADPLAGKTAVAGYQILGELGRGGMGVVYKARQPGANRIVALKMVLNSGHAGQEALIRFRIEAEAIALLQHPNIVQLYEAGEADGCPFFSLEFVEGDSLSKKIEDVPQPARESAHMVQRLAEAMYVAHQRGIIHRDLKPANVLLTLDGVPKITDFGLAKRFEDQSQGQTRTGAIMGTPSYMAPEQAEGRTKETGPAADIYSLGAILYDMLTGRPPFRGSTLLETLQQVKTLAPVAPKRLQPSLPYDLQTICLKSLEKEPTKRYATAGALAEDLRRFLAGEPILARPTPWYERSWKWVKRRPAAASLIAVLVLGSISLLTLGGLWLDSERRSAEAVAVVESKRAADQAAAREKEEILRKAAERNFKRAKAAVDEMLSEVGQDRLRSIPQMEPIRRDLLKKAKTFYDEFMTEQSADPAIRLEAALAQQRVADILEKLGDTAFALKAYDSALNLFQRLDQEFPDQKEIKKGYANVANNYGNLFKELKRNRDAEQNYKLALQLRETLHAQEPANAEIALELAKSHNNWAQILSAQGNGKGAAEEFQKSRQILDSLALNPGGSRFTTELARTLNNLGILQNLLGANAAAEATLAQAGIILRDLVAKEPDDPGHRQDQAQNLFLQARLFRDTDVKKAEADYLEAVQLQDRLVKDFLYTPAYRQELANSFSDLAILLQTTGRQKEADDAYNQALDLQRKIVKDFSHLPDYRFSLGSSLNNRAIMLLGTNRSKEAEAAFLEAMNVFVKLKEENADIPQYAMELADTCQNLGAVWQVTQPKKALDIVRQATEVRAELARKNPDSTEHQEKLARAEGNLGLMLLSQKNAQSAQTNFRRAVDIFSKLTKENAGNPDYRHQLAVGKVNLGMAARALNQLKDAEEEWRQAIVLYTDLLRDFPDVPGYGKELGKLYNELGVLQSSTQSFPAAEKAWNDGISVQEQLVANRPDQLEYRIDLGRSHGNLGILFAQAQNFERAEKQYRKGIALLEEYEPKLTVTAALPTYVGELVTIHQNLANLMVALQKPAEAEKSWLRILELREKLVQAFPQVPEYRLAAVAKLHELGASALPNQKYGLARTFFDKAQEHLHFLTRGMNGASALWNDLYVIQYQRAVCLVGLKDYEGAYQAVHELAPQAKKRADHLAAALMARCAGQVDPDSPVATKYAAEAVTLLRRAMTNGFNDTAYLNNNEDFQSLRARADFEAILTELKEKTK